MHKIARTIAMTGVAVAAGLTMAAGPAAASPATPSAPEATPKAAATKQQDARYRDRIYDYFRSPRTCHRVGRAGVWNDRWENYQCFQVWRGFHRGDWALKVYYGWGDHDFHGGPGGHGHGGHGGHDWKRN